VASLLLEAVRNPSNEAARPSATKRSDQQVERGHAPVWPGKRLFLLVGRRNRRN